MSQPIAVSRRSRIVFQAALGALALLSPMAMAQPVGSGSPPPTYDYDAATPGVQPPTSPLLAGYTYRSVRTYQFTVPVLVPVSDLTYLLPPGFTPVPSASGSPNATMNLSFFLDQRFQPNQGGPAFGPTSAVLGYVTAVNSNVSPARQELVFPLFEASSEIDALNSVFGAGAARLAAVTAGVTESDGMLRFQFNLSDPEIGFKVKVTAECPAAIVTRAFSDPVGLPFRTLTGLTPNGAFRASSQSDALTLSPAAANLQLSMPGHRLKLAGGALPVAGIGSTITFNRNVEFVVKFE